MTSLIYSVVTTKRLFKEQNADLAVCHPNMVEAVAVEFEKADDHTNAANIRERFAALNA